MSYDMHEPELMLEQVIAAQAVEKDPKLALKIAQENLKKRVSLNLLRLLRSLQQKDSEAATHLAVDIVKKLQTEDTTNHEAGFTAIELLRSVLQPTQNDLGAPIPSQGDIKVKRLVLDDETVRDLAETVVNAALSASNHNPGALIGLQSLLPDLEKRLPGRIPQLRQRLAEVTQAIDPTSRAWMKYEPLMRNGSTDAILTAAAESRLRCATVYT